jgi:hypothetical protein
MQPGQFLATVRTLICHKQGPLRSPAGFRRCDIHTRDNADSRPTVPCLCRGTATRNLRVADRFSEPDTTRVVPSLKGRLCLVFRVSGLAECSSPEHRPVRYSNTSQSTPACACFCVLIRDNNRPTNFVPSVLNWTHFGTSLLLLPSPFCSAPILLWMQA